MAVVGAALINFEADFGNIAASARKAGGGAADQFGGEFTRDVNGRLRNSRGHFVKEGEALGRSLGDGVHDGSKRGWSAFSRAGSKAGRDAGEGAKRGYLGGLKGLAAGAGALFAGQQVFSLLGDSVEEARESAKVSRLTANAIKVTGGAANISAGQVGKLAEAISNKTGIDDEQIQTASNMLLTFKNIREEAGAGNDVFSRATAAAADLSVQFGGIDGASKQLGKALNDPIKGISALGKAGVTFSDEQKKQITNFTETGDLLSAQKIILGEVESQVGGAAAAAADPMQKLSVIIGNLKERLGTALLPIIERVATYLGDNLPSILDRVGGAFGTIMDIVVPLGKGFKTVADTIVPVFKSIIGFIKENPTPVFAGLAAIVLPFFAGWAISAGLAAAATLLAVAPVIAVAAAIALLVGGLVYAYQNFDTFRGIVDTVFAAVKTVVTTVVNFVVDLFRTYLIPAAMAVGRFFIDVLWPAIQTAWDGILGAIQTAWGFIQTVFNGIVFFVQTFLIPIFNAFLGVAQFVWSLVWAIIQDAWDIIQPIFSAVVGFIRDHLVTQFETFKGVAETVWGAVSTAVSVAWDAVAPILLSIVGFVQDHLIPVWDGIASAVSTAFDKIPGIIGGALRLAGNIVAGFMRGAAGIADVIGLDSIAGALKGGADKADRWGEGGNNKAPGVKEPGSYARGGSLPPFMTNGARAIVGEGNPNFPEYVIPTDPKYRGRAQMLWRQAGTRLLAAGGTTSGPSPTGAWADRIKGVDFIDNVKAVGSDLVGKLREVAAGSVEKVWPKMDVGNNILGLIPGGLNYVRESIIDKIKGEADKKLKAEEKAMSERSTNGSGLGASTTGINPDFLKRFWDWSAATGGKYRIGSGFRSYAKQAELYRKYLSGNGALAAPPGRSNHERGLAIDTSPSRTTAADRALAGQFGLHFPLLSRGEPWHIEPFARGGVLPVSAHARSFDTGGTLNTGWNMVRNDTGAPEPLVPAGGPAVHIDKVVNNDRVDMALMIQGLSLAVAGGRL